MDPRRSISILALLAAAVVAAGCSARTTEASPELATGAESAAATNEAPVTPSPTATPTPVPSPVAWTIHQIPTNTTDGGSGVAIGGPEESPVIHVVVSNLEEALETG